jgi:hypothetical protein
MLCSPMIVTDVKPLNKWRINLRAVILFKDSFSLVSRIKLEVTNEPCIALNNAPPNTPATPAIWNGCIKILCSARTLSSYSHNRNTLCIFYQNTYTV